MSTTAHLNGTAPAPDTKPRALPVCTDNIPAQIQKIPAWVVWRYEWKKKESNWTKPPRNARTGALASTTDPTTWSTCAEAITAYGTGQYDGIGFVLHPDIGMCGIDIDHCNDKAGNPEAWAAEIIAELDSYAERSPSGLGLRVFCFAALPAGWRKLSGKGPAQQGGLEMYSAGRFLTFTGHRLADCPTDIMSRQGKVTALHGRHAPRVLVATSNSDSAIRQPLGMDAGELLERVRRSQQAAKFTALYEHGDLSAYDGDDSRADAALSEIVAWWSGCDTALIDQVFRASALMRPKWDEQRGALTYGQKTIEFAVGKCLTTYSPLPPALRRAIATEPVSGPPPQLSAPEFPAVEVGEQLPALDRDFIQSCYDEDEVGDAKLFARLYHNRLIFDYAEKCFNRWAGHSWQRCTTGMERRLLSGQAAWQYLNLAATLIRESKATENDQAGFKQKLADSLMSRARKLRKLQRIKNVLELAASYLGTEGEQWDKQPHLLAVKNGVIDLKQRTFRPGHPEDYLRTVAPTEWKGFDEPAPRFERFLLEIQNNREDIVAFLQRLLGSTLWGEVRHHILPILWGPQGRNGKDTLFQILSFVLGPLVGAVPASTLMASRQRDSEAPTPFLYDLRGKRMVWANETNQGAQLNAAQVKHLTGGGQIVARLCRGNAVHFEPTHTPFLITNEKPVAKSDDSALWSRLYLIEFTLRFVENPQAANERHCDLNLPATLRTEASGILAWLVRGCFEADDHHLNPPEVVTIATEKYRVSEDTVATFVSECCDLSNKSALISATTLYNAYREFTGEAALSQKAFGLKVADLFVKKTTSGRKFYIGVALLDSQPKLTYGRNGDSGDSGDRPPGKPHEHKKQVANNPDGASPLSPSGLFAATTSGVL